MAHQDYPGGTVDAQNASWDLMLFEEAFGGRIAMLSGACLVMFVLIFVIDFCDLQKNVKLLLGEKLMQPRKHYGILNGY